MPMNPSRGYLTISLNCIVCLAIFVWLLFMTAFDLPAKFMIIGEQTKDFCMQKVCFLKFLKMKEFNVFKCLFCVYFAYLFACKHVNSCLSFAPSIMLSYVFRCFYPSIVLNLLLNESQLFLRIYWLFPLILLNL